MIPYRIIPLTRGQVAWVDEEDYEWVSAVRWQAQFKNNTFYATCGISRLTDQSPLMHRQILGLNRGDPRIGDHREPSMTLDNRRSNLRIATPSQNGQNTRIGIDNTSGVKGVHWCKFTNRWRAQIRLNKKTISLGSYKLEEKERAAEAYRVAAVKYFGEFARF